MVMRVFGAQGHSSWDSEFHVMALEMHNGGHEFFSAAIAWAYRAVNFRGRAMSMHAVNNQRT